MESKIEYCHDCKQLTKHWISLLPADEKDNKIKIQECSKCGKCTVIEKVHA